MDYYFERAKLESKLNSLKVQKLGKYEITYFPEDESKGFNGFHKSFPFPNTLSIYYSIVNLN